MAKLKLGPVVVNEEGWGYACITEAFESNVAVIWLLFA
jgi:hypothetical protein